MRSAKNPLAALGALLLVLPSIAAAAPEAHMLRIDPRTSQSEGAPVLTTVIELVQNKRMSDALAPCAPLRGDAQLDCQSEHLETPQALYAPLAPFPEQAAMLTVMVDGADRPANLVSKARWGESNQQPGVGTAWLILIDAGGAMGPRFEDAKRVAEAFINSMTPHDIVDVMFFNDRQVVADSKWNPAASRAQLGAFVRSGKLYPSAGRVRPLFNILKTATTDGFKELGNSGSNVLVPLHQSLVVLSDGSAGSDPSSTGPASGMLQQYMTKGRFPEDNTVLPKTPLPVISVWFPAPNFEEFRENAQEFMQNFANPEIGGFYDIVRAGQGAAKGGRIVAATRTRFNQMHLVKWRVSCIAPTVTQTFKLVFSNTQPQILGDSTFREVPMGIDPTAWPLDVDVAYTQKMAQREPVRPDGKVTVYGKFCWGGEKDRAEVYFLPKGTEPPAAIAGTDYDAAKRAQQQLIASGLRGKAEQSSDSDVVFTIPDKDKVLSGASANQVARLVVYDNKAHRTSGVTATTILTLSAAEKAIPWLFIVLGALGAVVVALLVLLVGSRRGGGRRGGPAAVAPMPMVASPQPFIAGPPQPMANAAHAPPPGFAGASAGPAGRADFLYGGAPPQYGLTSAQPQAPAPLPVPPPPSPYGAAAAVPGGAQRAVLSGPGGNYVVPPNFEMHVGRDGAKCQVVLAEPRVSGCHSSLKIEGGYLYIKDLNSNNGTFLDGNRLPPEVWTRVSSGGRVGFGPVEFLVQLQ